ncbi:MAG: ADP-ribosylglycohydrolase family protein [Victivallaceae bacterium]|nr:ADP-ribosylglycohydrolase family protein [Victivallaceae bacterium]
MSVNCGRDADCTTATVGAILGIINPTGIEEKWLKPIGRKLVINDGIVGISPPDTLEDFTEMIISLHERVTLPKEYITAEIDFSKYTIRAECGIYSPWFAQDENKFKPEIPPDTQTIDFPGVYGCIEAAKIFSDSLYMMRFKFILEQTRTVRVMFNTTANSRIWIDGEYAFGRESGRMAPSFHRCPENQYADMKMQAGKHELLVGIAPADNQKKLEWIIGVGDSRSKQWLIDIWR